MRILITGINGFIGSHLGRKLVQRGHVVTGVGRGEKCNVSGIKAYYRGSVLNRALMQKVSVGIDVVVHLAALTAHRDISENKFVAFETNFLGTKNVLDAFSKSKTTKKFLYPSTGKVYGNISQLPITEDYPTNPQNALGKSKLITEKLIDFYSNNQKEFIIFRIFNVYGSSQREGFLVPAILKQIHEGKKEIVLGDIDARRDWVYIDDLVNAFVKTIEGKGNLGVFIYNICTGIGSSARDIVRIISKLKGVDIKVKINPSLKRVDEMKDEYGSFELAQRILGWKPKVNLKDGLQRLLN